VNTFPHSSQILIYGRINGIITKLMNMQNSTPCLSVVLPCYNEEGTIRKCVDAVLSNPWVGQLVIVDDGSTDKTR
jgi:cellulose synthase/poly-beta-1,6-N-acetylglucosamine synthase-like glycosyltransferase